MSHIAIIGCGLVGRAWAIVFARAECNVRLWDAKPGAGEAAIATIERNLADLAAAGLVAQPAEALRRICIAPDLETALAGAEYVQESVFEEVEAKRQVFHDIDACLGPATLIGSSSSGIPASAFTAEIACRARCLIAHPVNPPYLIPVVELVPAPWTDPVTVRRVRALMEAVGQSPVELTREIEGFIVNRLQGVLLMEAWRLVEEGYATVADIDRTMSQGLGLRWSFLGPFETIDLNAPGGVADYAQRLAPLYCRIAASRESHRLWSPELIAEVERQCRAILPQSKLADRTEWRDRRLMALAAHKRNAES
jgi:L-gulonate 3-dehydrogenase